MNKLIFPSVFLFLFFAQQKNAINLYPQEKSITESIPSWLKGEFQDDYGIRYTISDSLWWQQPRARYHIIKWNAAGQYLIARNDDKNPSEAGLYSRIDYMSFANMEPWQWGFCLTVYNAKTDSLAEVAAKADRLNPRKGCGGYPFSRMKRVGQ
jgi:hypothetical protein